MQTCQLRRTVFGHGLNGRPCRNPELLGIPADGGYRQPNIGLGNITLFYKAFDLLPHIVDRNGKADVVDGCPGGRGVFGVGDADDLPVKIKQRATGIAGIDGTVRLEQIHGYGVGKGHTPVLGADSPCGEGKGQLAQRITDGNDTVAHMDIIRVADNHRAEAPRIDLQNRQIVAFVAADQPGVVNTAVIHAHPDAIGAFDHMVVGDDIAILR